MKKYEKMTSVGYKHITQLTLIPTPTNAVPWPLVSTSIPDSFFPCHHTSLGHFTTASLAPIKYKNMKMKTVFVVLSLYSTGITVMCKNMEHLNYSKGSANKYN